jgi:hypothetical protein
MNNNQLNDLFLRIAEELDISDTLFERAEASYQALGEYINNHCDCSVSIYTQGSFRLGTVIRPLTDEDDYRQISPLYRAAVLSLQHQDARGEKSQCEFKVRRNRGAIFAR